MKIPSSFKFSETIDRLLNKLAAIPEYGNKTRVIEVLVWNDAMARNLVEPTNNHPHKRKKNVRK